MTEGGRSLALGRAGEQGWQQLEAAYRIAPGTGRALIIADSAELRAELRRRFELLGELHRLTPGAETLEDIDARANAKRPPIIWLEAPPDADLDAVWGPALLALNRGRDLLGDAFVVLVGDQRVQALLSVQAPDLVSVLAPSLVFDDQLGALVEPSAPLCWMHLSDLHIHTHDWQQHEVLSALLRDLRHLLARAERVPELLFVTGDLTYSGTKKQYEGARRFLDELLDVLGLEPERLFLVPGNHDVERGAIGPTVRLAQASIMKLDPDERRRVVGELLDQPDELGLFGARLDAWCHLTRELLGPARAVVPSKPFRADVVELHGVRVGVASSCSVWLSGPDKDQKKLSLGARQLRRLVSELDTARAQLRVALVHHPLAWLEDNEAGEVEALLREHFDLVLHGHLHRRSATCDSDGSRSAIWMGAGAAYHRPQGDRWQGFFVGQLDSRRGRVEIDAYTWSSHGAGSWHTDTSFDRKTGSSRRALPFRALELDVSEAVPASQLEALAAQLRQVTLRVHGAVTFAGLPRVGPWPPANLTQLYVPQRFVASGSGRPRELELDALADSWLRPHAESELAPRVVILGDPGSGKSTLCKHLAVSTARRPEGLVPLLVTVRGWLADGVRGSLLAHVATLTGEQSAVTLDEASLAELCENGRALLLVDGVDEAGRDERERLRSQLHDFAQKYPRVPIVVTSRVLGYNEVRLDRGFEHLTLAAFDHDDIRRFVERWYATAERSPEKARDRANDLLYALHTTPAIEQLARTPLLITLIAALHFNRGALPGRRARLYHRCIELLVDTWPLERGDTMSELPGDWQIERLAELALWMQRRRRGEHHETGVLVDERALEGELCRHLDDRNLDEPARRDLARRWLRWLVRSNVLSEERHGYYAFVHLSLMEYLAGQAVLREQRLGGSEAIVGFIRSHHLQTRWVEILISMLGSEADDRRFCDTIVGALVTVPDGMTHPHGRFLLELLREELALADVTRDALLDEVVRTIPGLGPRAWGPCRAVVSDLLRFSQRHGPALRSWIEAQLRVRSGRELLAVMVILPPDFDPAPLLELRSDDELDLIPLLELDRADHWGEWAHARAQPNMLVDLARRGAIRGILPHVLVNFATLNRHSAGVWVAGLQRRACWLARDSGGTTATLGWRSTTACFEATSAPAIRCTTSDVHEPLRDDSPGYLKTAFWDLWFPFLAGIYQSQAALALLPAQAHRAFGRLGQTQWPEKNLSMFLASVSDDRLDPELLSEPLADFGHKTLQYVARDTDWISLQALVTSTLHVSERPTPKRPLPDTPPVTPWTLDAPLPEPLPDTWPMVVAFFASFHAGVRSSSDPNPYSARGEAHVQNLWLNLFFDAIVELAHTTNEGLLPPESHALLLALGLAQFQTTWHWPLSQRWQGWFAEGAPPTHWLCAYVWHLCWAVADPETPKHLERARVCLEQGDWPELVAALREHPIEPM